ncbi:MAG: replication restart helicase PriA, partial [Chloroflexota bacterium]
MAHVRYVEVVVDTVVQRGAHTYTYLVPEGQEVAPGQAVRVPFGKQELSGVVLRLDAAPLPQARQLTSASDTSLLPHQLALAQWLAARYAAPIKDTVALFLPPERVPGRRRRIARLAAGLDWEQAAARLAAAPRQLEVLEMLRLAPSGLDARVLPSDAGLRELVRRELASVDFLEEETPPAVPHTAPILPLRLTQAQEQALLTIREGQGVFLLHGVTGSGKTEVYLQAMAHTVAAGRQAIMLVPEISLTPQTIARCASRFGRRVAVLHSALSPRERWSEWQRVRTGAVDVVIGPRSALFAPLERLGLIVVDEEHDWTYKQEQSPRYHARDAAVHLAELVGAKVVLGSATPDIGSYVRAQKGTYTLLTLPERISSRPALGGRTAAAPAELPPVRVVDMRQELQAGNRGIFSRELTAALRATLLRAEQTILFLNRRGASTFVICRECGHVLQCVDCLLPFTFHSVGGRLMCHNCGRAARTPERCPECASARIRFFGLGTQRVVDEVEALLPQARVRRWDRDTARTREDHAAMVEAMREHQVDVLVGTQMVAKGHDFQKVTLVGVVSADAQLGFPDFRAAERTFQLLTQVAGRAGRGELAGEVLVETHYPEHYAIELAARQDYASFFEKELHFRRLMHYPPFASLAMLLVRSTNLEQAIRWSRQLEKCF